MINFKIDKVKKIYMLACFFNFLRDTENRLKDVTNRPLVARLGLSVNIYSTTNSNYRSIDLILDLNNKHEIKNVHINIYNKKNKAALHNKQLTIEIKNDTN